MVIPKRLLKKLGLSGRRIIVKFVLIAKVLDLTQLLDLLDYNYLFLMPSNLIQIQQLMSLLNRLLLLLKSYFLNLSGKVGASKLPEIFYLRYCHVLTFLVQLD